MVNTDIVDSGKEELDKANLNDKTLRGLAWVGIGNIFAMIINIISRFILIRLLFPSDFGLMTLCLLVTSTLGQFNEFGMVTAFVQRRDKLELTKNTLFIITLFLGSGLFTVLLLSAAWIANFFKNPDLTNPIKVSSLAVLIMSFSHVPNGILIREIEFKKKFIPDIFSILANNACSVLLAFLGLGIWSLVWGNILGVLIYALLLWYICGWKPQFKFDKQVAKELISYGKYVYVAGFIAYLFLQLDKFATGKILGVTLLGYYSVAYNLSNLAVTNVTHLIGKVAGPLFAKLQSHISDLRNAVKKIMELNLIFVLPILSIIFFLTYDLVSVAMGHRWLSIIMPIKILCVAALFRSMYYVYEVLFQSTGYARVSVKIRLAGLCLLGVAIYPSIVNKGILGVSYTILGVMMFVFCLGLVNAYRLRLVDKTFFLLNARPLALSITGMFIIVYVVKFWLKTNSIFSLVITLVLAGVSYFTILVLSKKDIGLELRRFLPLIFK